MKNRPDHTGLSADEAARRLATEGPNMLPAGQRRLFAILLEAISEPMFLLLIAAAILYLTLGELNEGLLLFFMVCITIGLTLYQEGKTERALEALRGLTNPRALVLRDGKATQIPGSDVVRGDLLIVSEGDRVAADGVLIAANNVQADESLLTGEAWPVKKSAGTGMEANGKPGGEDLPFIWSGTLVVRGEGIARVTATGPRSEVGKIGSALQRLGVERSPLQREVSKLVRVVAIAGLAVSFFVTVAYGLTHGEWLQAILVGIALSMSMLPEEFPVILAVFPAIGAWRMSRVQVLTRRLPAIETLGSISVLCTDKTGTLTENRMKVTQLHTQGGAIRIDDRSAAGLDQTYRELAEFASLASKQQAFDPMEKAFHQLAQQTAPHAGDHNTRTMLREYPLSSKLRAMSQVWQTADDGRFIVATKGAPEAIAALCRLDEAEQQSMKAAIEEMATQGLRVLAVARAEFSDTTLPESQHLFDFRYLGLIGLTDPLRPEIPEAVRQCNEAGIRVIMITGDYPATAASIARQAGLPAGSVLAGDELDTLDVARLALRLREANVCARITPEQKLRIVQALKSDGAVVAMTGDGVNDAPALKAAHVGVAMGGRGTDVAREAATLVLLDDNFASIVRGIRLGRRIFSNMQNAMSYVLSMHVPIAGMALLPVLFGWPILLYPMHIAFLELIIDPACSLAFENESSDEEAMRRPPRDPGMPLIAGHDFITSLLQGLGALILVALAFVLALKYLPEAEARTATFSTLVIANLALLFSNLSHRRSIIRSLMSKNRIPRLLAALAIAGLLLTIYLPYLAPAFRFAPLSFGELLFALGFGLTGILWFELIKFFGRPTQRKQLPA